MTQQDAHVYTWETYLRSEILRKRREADAAKRKEKKK